MTNEEKPSAGRNVREVKIFVSSPGDVMAERQRLERVAERLNGRLGGGVHLRCVRWEERFYKAHDTFQAQIESAATCDIVVSIFWTRLGTELPPEFAEHLPDGRPYPSGTAYEVLTALEAAREKPMPDVYVFRKTQRPLYPDPDNETETQLFESQLKALRGFWEEWFRSRAGQFHAAFNTFETTDQFEEQAEKLLYEWLASKGLLEHEVRWRIAEQGSPFRGLLPFEASHAEVFFGRSAEIERGRERLVDAAARKTPFLLVLGASGSGKSSLARAGLIPRLIAPGAVSGVDVWRVARHAPGLADPDPLHSLAVALLDDEALPELKETANGTPDGIARQLAAGGEAAVGLVRWALDHVAEAVRVRDAYTRPVETRLLLLADQFEGLFAGSIDGEKRAAFVAALDALVRSGLVWTIATMRSTEYAPLQANAGLLKLKEDGATLDIALPDARALADAIRGPAEAAGLAFERDAAGGQRLDEILLADAGGADALPLLQFTLQRLFEGRQERDGVPTLLVETYRSLGGIEGAIAAEAERAVSALPAQAQEQLPWLLRHLVTAGKPGGASLVLHEMEFADADLTARPGAAALIDALASARVLVLSGGGGGLRRGRLAHEAVLRSWQRAHGIVESNAHYFQQYALLQSALDRCEGEGFGKDHLLRGTPLSQAEDLVRDYGAELPARMREFVRASRREADRGRRIAYAVAAAMAVLFVFATAGGIYALHARNVAEAHRLEAERQRVEAEQQRAEAQRHYAVAKKMTDSMVENLALRLRSVEGVRAEVVREILSGARTAYDGLAAAAPNDLDLKARQAAMYMAFSGTYETQGDSTRQMSSAKAALAITQELVGKDPGNLPWQFALSRAHERVAKAFEAQGKLDDAVKEYRIALSIRGHLAKADPSVPDYQRAVSSTWGRLGDVLLSQDDVPQALKAYSECLAIRERLAKAYPANASFQRNLADAYKNFADLYKSQKKWAEALKSYRDVLAIVEGLAKANPGNARWQRDLAVANNDLGDVLLAQGKGAEALKPLREALAITERLTQSDPGNVKWQRDLSDHYVSLGDLLKAQGNRPEALKAFHKALEIRERLVESDKDNARTLFDIVTVKWRLAQNGEDAKQNWTWIVETLVRLRDEARLSAVQLKWLPEARAELAKLKSP